MVVESIVTFTICRSPVTARDRVELVPGMEKVVGRSVMGRLGGEFLRYLQLLRVLWWGVLGGKKKASYLGPQEGQDLAT